MLHKVGWFDWYLIFHCSVHLWSWRLAPLCVYSHVSALLVKHLICCHRFHTRQNNGYKKRARDKLYFSIPAQLKASFRLLINRNFPVKPFKDSSLSLPQLTMSMCPCWDALRVWVRQQVLVRHTHPQYYCICVCDLSFGVVYVFKNPASLWGWKHTCLFSSSSTKNQS